MNIFEFFSVVQCDQHLSQQFILLYSSLARSAQWQYECICDAHKPATIIGQEILFRLSLIKCTYFIARAD